MRNGVKNLKVFLLICVLLLGGILYPFSALAIFLDDFIVDNVNDTVSGGFESFPDYPRIGCDSAGNFVCLWVHSKREFGKPTSGKLYIKGYDSQGQVRFSPKLMPTDSMKVYSQPAIYVSLGGDFVVACSDWWNWETGDSIRTEINIQRYDINGNQIGDRISFFFSDSSVSKPDEAFVNGVGMDLAGRIIVVWQSGSVYQAWGQIFDVDNNPIGSAFKVNESDSNITVSEGVNPTIAVYPNGRFVVVFDAFVNGHLQTLGRIYDSQGNSVTGLFLLSCDTVPITPCGGIPSGCNPGVWPEPAIVNERNFIVAWNACGEDEWNYVYERVFDSLGNPLTSNRRLNNVKANTYDVRPVVDCDGQGNCVAIWADDRNSYYQGPSDLFVQRLDSLGNPIASEERVNTVLGASDIGLFDVATNGKQVYLMWFDRRVEKPFDMYAQVMDLEKVGVFTPGDGTLDGKVNIQDIIHLVNYVFKGSKIPKSELWISDVTADCKVNLTDLIYLVNYVFRGGMSPKTGCA